MDDLVEDLSPMMNLAVNLGEEQSDGGIVRTVRPGSTITVTDFSAPFTPYDVTSGYVAPDYTAKTPVTVTLPNNATATSMAITAEEFRVLTGGPRAGVAYDKLLEKVNRMMMHGLKKKMAEDFLALVTSANYANNTVSAAGTFTRSTEIDIDTELFGRNLQDRENATLILSGAAYGEWAKDHVAINTNTGQPQRSKLISGGVPSQVTDFEVYRTNLALPSDAPRGFAYTRSGALLVSRIPDEATLPGGADPVSLREVVDDQTGLSFLVRLWKNAQYGSLQLDIAIIYKFQKLQGEAIERITTS
jgi:hypothetical protein